MFQKLLKAGKIFIGAVGAAAVVVVSTEAQMIPFAFIRGLIDLGSFSITGVGGVTDNTFDQWLTQGLEPKVSFGAASGATSYEIIIKTQDESSTVCQVSSTALTTYQFSGCNLSDGQSYKAFVVAVAGVARRNADNTGFSFTVDNSAPVANSITGVTGGTDVEVDEWLVGHLVPTVQWNAFSNTANYDVVIKDQTGTTEVCSALGVVGTSHSFSSCTLTNNLEYRVYVKAKSASGQNTADATNDGFLFTVDNNTLGSFSISGVDGGADIVVDAFLSVGEDPQIHFSSATGAYRYDLEVKDSTGTDSLCTLANQTTSPVLMDCNLEQGLEYKIYINAKTISGKVASAASNDGYTFSTSEPGQFPAGNFEIYGALALPNDQWADAALVGSLVPTIMWSDAAGATSYVVTIRNEAGTADICSGTSTSSTLKLSSCTLVQGQKYRINVVAKKTAALQTQALNNGLLFQVIEQNSPQFMIKGVYGGSDYSIDQFLASGVPGLLSVAWGTPYYGLKPDNFTVKIRDVNNTVDVCSEKVSSLTYVDYIDCNLTPGTDYRVYVTANYQGKSVAAANTGFKFSVANSLNICSATSSTAKAIVLFDSGGPNGKYSNNENCSFSFVPPGTFDYIAIMGSLDRAADCADGDCLDRLRIDIDDLGESYYWDDPYEYTYNFDDYLNAEDVVVEWESSPAFTAPGFALSFIADSWGPDEFSVIGVYGGADVDPDDILTDVPANGILEWDTSSGASTYDVKITDVGNNVICSAQNLASTTMSLASCPLLEMTEYTVLIIAKGNNEKTSVGDEFYFTYVAGPSVPSMMGVIGGTDTFEDSVLGDGDIATVVWEESQRTTSYDVSILEKDGVTPKCGVQNIAVGSSSHTFAGCNLVLGQSYFVELIAIGGPADSVRVKAPVFSFVVGAQWRPMIGWDRPKERAEHVTVWTGSEVLIWGGAADPDYDHHGYRYNPASDSWSYIPDDLGAYRSNATAVWTGTEMLVWGGYNRSNYWDPEGYRYNPVTNTWAAMSSTGAPSGVFGHSAVWTGTEMIVWGGSSGTGNSAVNVTGARYNPSTDTWTAMTTSGAPSARLGHGAVWTGTEMVVWGGALSRYSSTMYASGARYNPTTNTWTSISTTGAPIARHFHTMLWADGEVLVWGGYSSWQLDPVIGEFSNRTSSGARYNPTTNTWTSMSLTGAPPMARDSALAVWTGQKAIVFGGKSYVWAELNGAVYDPSLNSWTSISSLNAPTSVYQTGAVWTGTEMIFFGGKTSLGEDRSKKLGRYNLGTNSWWVDPLFIPEARAEMAAVWTGSELIIHGGSSPQTGEIFETGAKYSVVSDSWTPIAAEPASEQAAFVWTGSELLVWGSNGGARYDPVADTWVGMSNVGEPTPRYDMQFHWTGSQLLVWGGQDYDDGASLDDGGLYDPNTDTWTSIAGNNATAVLVPTMRDDHRALWTGTEMFVFGGQEGYGNLLAEAALYNPTTDTWRLASTVQQALPSVSSSAVWTGSKVIIWGGYVYDEVEDDSIYSNGGAIYDPLADSWTAMSTVGAPSPRRDHVAVWANDMMVVWGGYFYDSQEGQEYYLNTGGRYDPLTDTWLTTFVPLSAPDARVDHTAIWTGSEMIIWGGSGGLENILEDGRSYNPATDSWSLVETSGAEIFISHKAIWTGDRMVVFNTDPYLNLSNNIQAYFPATKQWVDLPYIDELDSSKWTPVHGFWTGSEILFWGGSIEENPTNEGFIYNPSLDSWRLMSNVGAPTPREGEAITWTGTELFVWSGEVGDTEFTTSGGRYNYATDTWTATFDLSRSPGARHSHTGTWTGSEMFVWGGDGAEDQYADGGLYNPATDSWTILQDPAGNWTRMTKHSAVWTGTHVVAVGGYDGESPTEGIMKFDPVDRSINYAGFYKEIKRTGHTAVWSGQEVLVWGGESDFPVAASFDLTNNGYRFNPDTNEIKKIFYTNIPRRWQHQAVWTGSEMLIFGGSFGWYEYIPTVNFGSRYNPATDSWAPMSELNQPPANNSGSFVWAGDQAILWTGTGETSGRYFPATDTWAAIAEDPFHANRSSFTTVWSGTEMLVWGGYASGQGGPGNFGSRYNPATDTWQIMSTGGQIPASREYHSAVWTGSEMIIWGGRGSDRDYADGSIYNPTTNSWTKISFSSDAPQGRYKHSAVWTGSEMIVYGGLYGSYGYHVQGSARFNPTSGLWAPVAPAPFSHPDRYGHTAIWTGSEMIIWGGESWWGPENSGGRYNPATDTWTLAHFSTLPTPRDGHTMVWAGTRAIVWGGYDGERSLETGSIYDPTTDSWSSVSLVDAPAPRYRHTALWTGDKMLVWGGYNSQDGFYERLNDGGIFDLATNSWQPIAVSANTPSPRDRHVAVWTGTEMIVWGGYGPSSSGEYSEYFANGAKFNLASGIWTPISSAGAPTARISASAVWTGSKMLVWGGDSEGINGNTYSVRSGGVYDFASDSWSTISTLNAPNARSLSSVVWTGTEMIIWGGRDNYSNYLRDGGRYNPATNSWTSTTLTGAPVARHSHSAVWTGSVMIIWGGNQGGAFSVSSDGMIYNPTTNQWSVLAEEVADADVALRGHQAVWTGTEMLVWGGRDSTGRTNKGNRYNFASQEWSEMSNTESNFVPSPRAGHSSVWTGSEMIIWGGVHEETLLENGARYNPTTRVWTELVQNGPVPSLSSTRAGAAYGNGKLFVWGGNSELPTASGGIYDLATETWTAVPTMTLGGSLDPAVLWTGSRFIVWGENGDTHQGGLYDPVTNTWEMIVNDSDCEGRRGHTGVWTGTEMIVWGGRTDGEDVGTLTNTGCRYNVASASWNEAGAPEPYGGPAGRREHSAVWTGTEMIIWGGRGLGTIDMILEGGRYNPSTDSWQPVSGTALYSGGVFNHRAVWTGSEMIVWSGARTYRSGGNNYQTGITSAGRYNPSTNTWSAMAFGPLDSRMGYHAAWTGTEMLIWGGYYFQLEDFSDGARYNPSTNTWSWMSMEEGLGARDSATSVWTGTEMIIWGGKLAYNSVITNTGARYNPSTDSWSLTQSDDLPAGVLTPRKNHTAVWTGNEMIVWGGMDDSGVVSDGSRYNPATNTWSYVSNGANTPIARKDHTAIWTGDEMLIWGGIDGDGGGSLELSSGARYNPVTDSWQTMSSAGAPSGRLRHTSVWTGSKMLVWGGVTADWSYLDTGAIYDPDLDSWSAIPVTAKTPEGRFRHSAVWTGDEMIIWGGELSAGEGTPTDSGSRYHLANNSWRVLGETVAGYVPAARKNALATWVGNKVFVWGGKDASNNFLDTGELYDPTINSWAPSSNAGSPPWIWEGYSSVWTGTKLLVIGGIADGAVVSDTRIYDPLSDSWSSGADMPQDLFKSSVVWTGSEAIVWGGENDYNDLVNNGYRYNPTLDSWTETSVDEPAGSGIPTERAESTAIWTGSEMIVWGGYNNDSDFFDGGRYNPTTDTWAALPMPPVAWRTWGYAHHWTGTEMILWGGEDDDDWVDGSESTASGLRYNPSTNSWSLMSLNGAPLLWSDTMKTVWTGSEMLVWGIDDWQYEPVGASYNPATDTWTKLNSEGAPAIDTYGGSAVWSGTEMIIWGGSSDEGNRAVENGYRYERSSGTWTPMTDPGPQSRMFGVEDTASVWTGSEFVVWGGYAPQEGGRTQKGARYNPATDVWTMIPISDSTPAARNSHVAVWTGTEMIIWGGYLGEPGYTGALWNPISGSWRAMSETGAPSLSEGVAKVWTGSEMIVWGVDNYSWDDVSGGIYNPTTNVWLPTSKEQHTPSPRLQPSAVWTGDEMLIWGGRFNGNPLDDGALFKP